MTERDKGIRLATYVSRGTAQRLRDYARRERRSVSGAAALLIEQGLDADARRVRE